MNLKCYKSIIRRQRSKQGISPKPDTGFPGPQYNPLTKAPRARVFFADVKLPRYLIEIWVIEI
jgi:hypothetical protein